jgi:uncharacterized circularly permuted ATP-grasp superfamily protein/uncharacterized alpha-E superfamily protein
LTLAYFDSVKDALTPLSAGLLPENASAAARPLPTLATPGHFDELRGEAASATHSEAYEAQYTRAWGQFFETFASDGLGALDLRAATLARQIRDNGVTYNVYSDEGGPQRPWSLDLFPLILPPQDWLQIKTGVEQRVRLLERVMADVYGPQQLLEQGLLPPALIQGHPGYLRAMHGVNPVGGTHLHIASFDLARGPDGHWWVVAQRTQAPSGLGYLLENRLAVSHLFPQAFEAMAVQRLAGTYRALMDSIRQKIAGTSDPHIALLTPGPYNETYFEHAYLARYLGLTLVEGSDLIVRGQRLFLKTLKGLEPVHALLKRVDDEFLDPLELRSDSTLGVPGLLQAIRAGNVLVANAPGSAFLESPALLGFLPALSRHLLGEELQMPSLPTWWCGERSAMESALPRLGESAIKPTYPGSNNPGNFDAVLGQSLSTREIEEWAGRIALHSDEHTVQAYLPLSQMPTWRTAEGGSGAIAMRSVMLRVFAVADGMTDGAVSWRILPGGLARLAGNGTEIASMQRGGSSADVWVQTGAAVDKTTLLKPPLTPGLVLQRKRLVTSRAGENLFWLGRYTERSENLIRLARLTLENLHGEDQSAQPLLDWLSKMAVANSLVLPGVPAATQAPRVFERSLMASLGSRDMATSVGYNLRALRLAGASVRERLSAEHWNLIVRVEAELTQSCDALKQNADYSPLEVFRILKVASDHLAAITGAQTDRMTRDDGWRLLSIGRHIERLGFLAAALLRGFETASIFNESGFEAMISLFDSSITFHAQYQQSRDVAALLELLVQSRDNPRSLGWVAHTLRGRLAKLAGSPSGELAELSLLAPDPASWGLEQLCTVDANGRFSMAIELLQDCVRSAYVLSNEVSAVYFTHSDDTKHSTGF